MPDEFLDGPVVANRLAVWDERLSEVRADRLVCLALEGSELIGFVCVLGNEDPVWGSLIDNLHVAAARHGTGAGRKLMLRAAQWLDRMYPQLGVYLWVYEANSPARRFYERLGASHRETINKRDPGGGYARSCRYVWTEPKALR